MKNLGALIFLLFISVNKLTAQTADSISTISVLSYNNQIFTGELIEITSDSIIMNSPDLGRLSFHKKDVKRFKEGMITKYFENTTNSSVPYYVQTGLPNGEGNHYYKNYYIFGNEFNFGVTDNLNLTAGFETASLVFDSGDRVPIIQLGGKYATSVSEDFHMGFYSNYYFNSEGSALLMGVPLTLGNKRSNFTLAPSYVRGDGSGYFGFFGNASISVGPRVRFVIDYAHVDGESISAILFEIMFNNGFTLSIGGVVADGSAPNIAFTIPFGKWKKKAK